MHETIKSKKDYREFCLADKMANHIDKKFPILGYDYIWIYLRILRSLEYLDNCNSKNFIWKTVQRFRFRQYSVKLGISIHPNTFGKGLTLWHYGSIIVNPNVDGGSFVTIQSDVNISDNVKIGNNVYIAPGVKILENVRISDGVIIGANAVVTHDIDETYTSWAGVPVRKISNKGNKVRTWGRYES